MKNSIFEKINNSQHNEELYEALLNGDPGQIIKAFKKIDFLADETLALVIRLLEGDPELIEVCRYRIEVKPWARRKIRNQFDDGPGHDLIRSNYAEIRAKPTLTIYNKGHPTEVKNGHVRTLDILVGMFDMKHRKLNQIIGRQKKKKQKL
ncbi:MAG: hypothetical protein ABI705_08120 [Aestuariivirga sp.]